MLALMTLRSLGHEEPHGFHIYNRDGLLVFEHCRKDLDCLKNLLRLPAVKNLLGFACRFLIDGDFGISR